MLGALLLFRPDCDDDNYDASTAAIIATQAFRRPRPWAQRRGADRPGWVGGSASQQEEAGRCDGRVAKQSIRGTEAKAKGLG